MSRAGFRLKACRSNSNRIRNLTTAMGGEWIFSIKGDAPETFDQEKYHLMLQEIKQKIQRNPDMYESVAWAESESAAEQSNVFATFSYPCDRHDWHKGTGPSWKLFWNPLQVPKEDRFSDIHARCLPDIRQKLARHEIQNSLVRAFPSVFELYLGDGISGYDDVDDGLDPQFYDDSPEGYDDVGLDPHFYDDSPEGYDDVDDVGLDRHFYDDSSEDMFTPETGYYMTGDGERVFAFRGEDPDFTACSQECGYCGRCSY